MQHHQIQGWMDRGHAHVPAYYMDWPSTNSGRTCTKCSTFMHAWNILNVNVCPYEGTSFECPPTYARWLQMDEYLMQKATFMHIYIWPWIDNCIGMRNVTIDNGKQMKLHSWEMNAHSTGCEDFMTTDKHSLRICNKGILHKDSKNGLKINQTLESPGAYTVYRQRGIYIGFN